MNISELDQCSQDCIAGCNDSAAEDPSLFRRNWYSLANSTVLYTLWAFYSCLFITCSFLLFWTRKIHHIKSRSPDMVLLSGVGGYLLVTNYAFAHYVTGINNWPCPFSHWALWLAFPLFLFPFPVRALQLYLVFKRNVDKVKNHKHMQEKTTQRVTVVAERFSVAMNGNGGTGTSSDIQKVRANYEKRKADRKAAKAKKNGAKIEEHPDDHDLDLDPEHDHDHDDHEHGTSNSTTVALTSGPNGSVAENDQEIKESSALKSLVSLFSKRKPSVQVLRRQTVRIADVTAAESGLINTQTNRGLLEKYIHHIFWMIVAICILTGLVRQFIPSLGLGAECVGCMVSLSSAIVQTIIVFIVLGIQLLSAIFIYTSQVKDQYKIGLELQAMAVIFMGLLFPACILALRGTECEELRTTHTSCATFDNFTKFCYYNFAAQHWLIVSCVVVTFIITVCIPVFAAYAKGRKKLLNEPVKSRYPKFKALTSLSECLADKRTSEAFQKFCVQSFCVEQILFWKDVEQYKKVLNQNEMRIRAVALYKRYIDASGTLFIELPEEIQGALDDKLSEAASKEDDLDDYDYNFQVASDVFEAAQGEVFRQMEAETFPQFLRSEMARKLFAEFRQQGAAVKAIEEIEHSKSTL